MCRRIARLQARLVQEVANRRSNSGSMLRTKAGCELRYSAPRDMQHTNGMWFPLIIVTGRLSGV